MSVKSMLDLIGDTPLIKLKRASEETGCTIFGKPVSEGPRRARHHP